MKTLLHACLAFSLIATASAQSPLRTFDWKNSTVTGATILTEDATSILKIENTSNLPLTVRLLTISNPPVTAMFYAVIGEIKYEKVQGDGYLEMWNCFPNANAASSEDQYFSRTLGESGEMGKISGTCAWRKFSLPFNRSGSASPPTRLEINLVLPGNGTVSLRPMSLVEPTAGPQSKSGVGWWSEQQAGIFGGTAGGVVGCLGALIGVLTSLGKARRFVLATTKAMIALGIMSCIAGLVALVQRQPYAVCYPLLLGGVICTSVCWGNLRSIIKRYDDLEIRRMTSLDAMSS